MTFHTKDALCSARITQVLNLSLAVATFEAIGAKGLISCQDSQILNLVTTTTATVSAVITYQRAIAEEKKIRIGIE